MSKARRAVLVAAVLLLAVVSVFVVWVIRVYLPAGWSTSDVQLDYHVAVGQPDPRRCFQVVETRSAFWEGKELTRVAVVPA